MPSKAKATAITDHDEIRRWAEERGAKPACVRNTGSSRDVGIIRLDFPGYSGEQSLEPIEWDLWFAKFDEQGLALLHQETTAKGEKSNFNKLISRHTAEEAHELQAEHEDHSEHAIHTAPVPTNITRTAVPAPASHSAPASKSHSSSSPKPKKAVATHTTKAVAKSKPATGKAMSSKESKAHRTAKPKSTKRTVVTEIRTHPESKKTTTRKRAA